MSRVLNPLVLTGIAFLLAVSASAAPLRSEKTVVQPTDAEEMFPDAEYGVDSMVTGPTSAAFKARQAFAGCADAKWPNVPAACYPG